ncbi:MAG: PAS domain-containing protein [Rhizomicrobium sp.]|nr:PAS domain-containing protein [Rhizomicrobium sp.]
MDSDPTPPTASFAVIGVEELRFAQLRQGYAYWESLCGGRAFPARDQLQPRCMAPLLTNLILIRVIDHGLDFEYRIVGDEVSRAYRSQLNLRRLSEVGKEMPTAATYWGDVYRDICKHGKPWAVRYSPGLDGEGHFSEAEAVLLPLGPSDDAVNHILTFGKRVYLSR